MDLSALIPALIVLSFAFVVSSDAKRPHIVFVLADDLGWYDVSWNDERIISPNLEKLREESLSLENYYVHSKCTPSRAAILTGYSAHSLMTQHGIIEPEEPRVIPLDVEMFPQKLQRLGYRTVAVGKWHLGYCHWAAVPTNRGFNEFFGVYLGAGHHFKHTKGVNGVIGHDFRENDKDITSEDGVYSAESFTNRAVKTIKEHNKGRPLYLYLSYLSVHTPLHVPKEYIIQNRPNFPDKTDKNRVKKAAMVTAMDEGIGAVVDALKEENMWDDTIFVFSSDNGAPVASAGYNWPYRGSKGTLFEGGTKSVAFTHGGPLPSGKFTGLFHASDWFPTLLSAATSTNQAGDREVLDQGPPTDGIDQWEAMIQKQPVRHEMVYNIDETIGAGAIRDDQYKLIIGWQEEYDAHYKHYNDISNVNTTKLTKSTLHQAFPDPSFGALLYDLKNDPFELNDLSDSRPDLVESLHFKMKRYESKIVKSYTPNNRAKAANPANWNGTWSPGWCTDTYLTTAGNRWITPTPT